MQLGKKSVCEINLIFNFHDFGLFDLRYFVRVPPKSRFKVLKKDFSKAHVTHNIFAHNMAIKT